MQGIHRKERENRKRKTLLTHTGLLMEGMRRWPRRKSRSANAWPPILGITTSVTNISIVPRDTL
jgi:hypothetical protein